MSYITSKLTRTNPLQILGNWGIRPAMLIGVIILSALFFFEIFNFSTTDYALGDLLGDLRFANIRWATALTVAFCAIDFAGVAKLFMPNHGEEQKETWYLFGAWLLAATMNAMLTWWGVSMAIVNHNVQSAAVVNPETIIQVVPVFVALMVWVIRILIIGSISVAGNHLLWGEAATGVSRSEQRRKQPATPAVAPSYSRNSPVVSPSMSASPSARRSSAAMSRSSIPVESISSAVSEPTYHSLSSNNTSHHKNLF